MNPQRDENQLRRYREASREIDERPSAGTRAAILAAAAREVGARPVDASADAVRTVRPRLRWPWAAAAAVMLSTLAVMMATRTEQEQPTFTAPPATPSAPAEVARERTGEPQPAADSAPTVAHSAPPAVASPSEVASDAQRANVPRPTQPLRKEKRELAAAPEPAAVARAKTDAVAEADASSAGASVAEPSARPPAAPLPAAPPATSPPMSTADAASGALGGLRSSESREAKEQRGTGEERPQRQDAAAGTAKTAQKPAADENEATVEQRPEDWLQKIVRLRTAGRHEEADAELKRFRERYPQWPVPPAALAPAATR